MPELTNPAARSAEIGCAPALATLIVIGSSAALDQSSDESTNTTLTFQTLTDLALQAIES